jgi:hypothetical protein
MRQHADAHAAAAEAADDAEAAVVGAEDERTGGCGHGQRRLIERASAVAA